jgi:amidophosphoribosyltransferase
MTGLFGIVTEGNCAKTLMFGTDYHSHLGTQQGGLATMRPDGVFDRRLHSISKEPFKTRFYEESEKMRGGMGIGAVSDHDTQPLFKVLGDETYALVTAGIINNIEQLADEICTRKDARRDDVFFRNNSDGSLNMTEVVAEIINLERSVFEGIGKVYEKVDGSCSLLLLRKEGLYAARDYRGRTPLVLGSDGVGWAVTTETCAFPNLGFKVERFLKPGEVVRLNDEGVLTVRNGDDSLMQMCSFLWVYTGDPSSSYEGKNVQEAKQCCGLFLAEGDADLDIDIIAGVPDSGIGHAHGYMNKMVRMVVKRAQEGHDFKIPFFAEPLIKYRAGYGRSYIPPDQAQRDEIAWNKLVPVGHILADGWDDIDRNYARGRSIVLVDDSIVRNTQLRNSIKKLWEHGAGEIHVRVACPPLTSPCQYLRATRTGSELAAVRAIREIEGGDIDDIGDYLDPASDKYAKMVDIIRRDLNVTSLKYLSLDGVVSAIGMPREQLCVDCWQ